MRISTEQVWRSSLQDVTRHQIAQTEAQARISSGKRIERASDDAAGAHRAAEMRAGSSAIEQYLRAGDDALGFLTAQDSTLQVILDRLGEIEELTIAAGNGTITGESREAVAQQLEELRGELVQLANTTHAGRSLFGGFQEAAVDDTPESVTLVGDDGRILRRIARNQVMEVNVDAGTLFGFTAGRSLFDVLDDIVVDTRAADITSLAETRTGELRTLRDSVSAGLGTVGARSAGVERTMQSLTAERDSLTAAVAGIEDADLVEASVAYSEANLAYEAALAVTAQVNRVSLLDYL